MRFCGGWPGIYYGFRVRAYWKGRPNSSPTGVIFGQLLGEYGDFPSWGVPGQDFEEKGWAVPDREMTLIEHLTELRGRLMLIIGVVGILFLVGFYAAAPVLQWLVARGHMKHMVVIGVPEAFFALIKVDLIMALLIASPLIMYEAAAFVFPGLTPRERRVVGVLAGPGLVLLLGGMAIGFFVFVPMVLRIMLSFVGRGVSEFWTLSNYLNFVIFLTIPFGILAEFPLVSGVMARLGMLRPTLFSRYRSYALVTAFIIAAIVAPPDAFSMLIIGAAIYGVYELSHGVAHLFYHPPNPPLFRPLPGEMDEA